MAGATSLQPSQAMAALSLGFGRGGARLSGAEAMPASFLHVTEGCGPSWRWQWEPMPHSHKAAVSF